MPRKEKAAEVVGSNQSGKPTEGRLEDAPNCLQYITSFLFFNVDRDTFAILLLNGAIFFAAPMFGRAGG